MRDKKKNCVNLNSLSINVIAAFLRCLYAVRTMENWEFFFLEMKGAWSLS